MVFKKQQTVKFPTSIWNMFKGDAVVVHWYGIFLVAGHMIGFRMYLNTAGMQR